ncbi:MAG: hypothetical protein Q8880_01080, partial [Bacteroidota bacterium]|nr:hypothetical protein [Bacteroidota bacterium]
MNERYIRLGKSDLIVSRIGISAFFWKDLSVVPRFNINRSGYGLVDNKVELRKAVECSLSAGVNFIDIGEVNCRRPEFNVGELINDKEFI